MKQQITLSVILEAVCGTFKLSISDMSYLRTRASATARQVYAYFAKKYTSRTDVEISGFVCRNFKLAQSATTKINSKTYWDDGLKIAVNQLEKQLEGMAI